MFDLVHYSNHVFAGLALALLAAIAIGPVWTNDEAARITSISISISIAYLPYFFAVRLASAVPETPQLRRTALVAAILFRLFAFGAPPVLSDDLLRYEWEAEAISKGVNPYRVSPAQTNEPNRRIPGYDFSAVYGPVLEAAHWATHQAGLPMKASAALAEGLLLILLWRQGLSLWRWLLVGWSPLCISEYWMNGHNDAWLLLLIALAYFSSGWISWLWLALATLTKWWPILLAPLWLRWNPSLAGVVLYALSMASCLLLMPLQEWILKVRFTTGFLGGWQNNAFLYRFLTDKMQAIGVNVTASIACIFLPLGKAEQILVFLTILLAFSANIHVWYLGWLLPVLAVSRWNPLPWLLPMALLPIAYDPMIGWRMDRSWVEDPLLRTWIWTAVTVFACYRWIRARNG